MPTTYTACTHCGTGLTRPVSQHIGLCSGCRVNGGWTRCGGCTENTISPKGDPCPICAAHAASVGGTAPTPTQVSTPKIRKVKCLQWAGTYFTPGKMYQVVGETSTTWDLINNYGSNTDVNKKLFAEVLSSDIDYTKTHQVVQSPTVDISDWRVWRDHNRTPDQCACGMLRSMCDYHRGG